MTALTIFAGAVLALAAFIAAAVVVFDRREDETSDNEGKQP
jgi:hypothetical protein